MHTLAQLRSGELKGIKRLSLSENLSHFPKEIYELADSLEILDLSHNQLSSLPDDLHKLKHLRIAFFSNNLFTHVPDSFKACNKLTMLGFKANQIERFDEDILSTSISWLILTDNRIATLPKSMGKLIKLQKCALAGNKIKELPQEMKACVNLELLRLSANDLESIPQWLLNLPRIAWLAFSGNPCSLHKTPKFTEIPYHDLAIEERLGEGASGEIYRAYSEHFKKEVAFKLFKGAVTSDGYAKDEMNAYMSISEHKGLIKVLAKLEGEKRLGLILELIPKNFRSLGLPPSLQTCTRDTFEEGTHFSVERIVKVAKDMASVGAHLHENALMHGDFYAHNILINEVDESYLGDFGAASFYDKSNPAFEKIEVRAFGCLLDDLLNLCDEKESKVYKDLRHLCEACMDEDISQRPRFNQMFTEQ